MVVTSAAVFSGGALSYRASPLKFNELILWFPTYPSLWF